MATGLQYQKVCRFCGNIFSAQKSSAKYCGEVCAKRGYKREKRDERLRMESDEVRERNRLELLSREYLSVSGAALLLDVSRPTIYKMMATGKLKSIRVGERIVRIKKSDLVETNLSLAPINKPIAPINTPIAPINTPIAPINTPIAEICKKQLEYVTVAEALLLFDISSTHFYNKIRALQIKPAVIKGKTLYPKNVLLKIFAKKLYPNIAEWYTVAEITEKFGVSRQYVYDYVYEHKMPKKRDKKQVLISKHDWDRSRGLDPVINDEYYTILEASAKFGIGRGHLYDLVCAHKIPKIRRGQNVLVLRQRLDEIMKNRKKTNYVSN